MSGWITIITSSVAVIFTIIAIRKNQERQKELTELQQLFKDTHKDLTEESTRASYYMNQYVACQQLLVDARRQLENERIHNRAFNFNKHTTTQGVRKAKRAPESILNVSKGASDADLAKAKRELLMKYHPDRNPGFVDEAAEKCKEINQAYEEMRKHQ